MASSSGDGVGRIFSAAPSAIQQQQQPYQQQQQQQMQRQAMASNASSETGSEGTKVAVLTIRNATDSFKVIGSECISGFYSMLDDIKKQRDAEADLLLDIILHAVEASRMISRSREMRRLTC